MGLSILGYMSQLVLSFDLGDEVFRLISLPNGAFRKSFVQTSVIEGSLSLLFYDDRHVDNSCCANWVMKDYGVVDSCTKLFAVDVNKEIIRVLGLQKNGSILVEACSFRRMAVCLSPENYFHVDNYVENLVLLNKLNDAVSERGVSRKRKCRSTSDEERVRQQKTQLEERVCQQKTLLQQQDIILKQQEITLKQQREEMAWQTQKMVTLKSQLAILIQQLWGQICLVVLEIKVRHKYNRDPLLQVRKRDLIVGLRFCRDILL